MVDEMNNNQPMNENEIDDHLFENFDLMEYN
jgi:hypothetical protein